MIKITHIFEYTSVLGRAGGWSESWYTDTDVTTAITRGDRMAKARCSLLPSTVNIVAYRVQVLGGRAQLVTGSYPGVIVGANVQDVPQMAMFCSIGGLGVPNVKRFFLRGIPDGYVVGGDLQPVAPNAGGNAAFQQILLAYSNSQVSFQCINTTNAFSNILSIDALGNVVLSQNLVTGNNQTIRLYRVRDTSGKSVTGNFVVQGFVDQTHFQLAHWPGVVVGASGKMRALSYSYPVIDARSGQILHVGVRKIGRPFLLYHGRAKRRR